MSQYITKHTLNFVLILSSLSHYFIFMIFLLHFPLHVCAWILIRNISEQTTLPSPYLQFVEAI